MKLSYLMSSITLTQEEIQAVIDVIDLAVESKSGDTIKGMYSMVALLNQGLHQNDGDVEFQIDDDFNSYVYDTLFSCLYEGAYASVLQSKGSYLKDVDDKYNDAVGNDRGTNA